MTYKTNFEPYVSRSPDIKSGPAMRPFSEDIDPLRSLYPYVTSLQRQSNIEYSTRYSTSYWEETYTSHPSLEEGSAKLSLRRLSDISGRRFVSRLRRFLGRDEARRGIHASLTTRK